MHPPLFRPHPLCFQVVNDLVQCHDDNPILKIFGSCNEVKYKLDVCFKFEKEVQRKVRARAKQEEMAIRNAAVDKAEKLWLEHQSEIAQLQRMIPMDQDDE